jgi:hypothetical protein
MKGVQATGEAFSPQKKNILIFSLLDPDPHSQFGSESSRPEHRGTMWIRIHWQTLVIICKPATKPLQYWKIWPITVSLNDSLWSSGTQPNDVRSSSVKPLTVLTVGLSHPSANKPLYVCVDYRIYRELSWPNWWTSTVFTSVQTKEHQYLSCGISVQMAIRSSTQRFIIIFRIQQTKFNADPCGSRFGSTTLVLSNNKPKSFNYDLGNRGDHSMVGQLVQHKNNSTVSQWDNSYSLELVKVEGGWGLYWQSRDWL